MPAAQGRRSSGVPANEATVTASCHPAMHADIPPGPAGAGLPHDADGVQDPAFAVRTAQGVRQHLPGCMCVQCRYQRKLWHAGHRSMVHVKVEVQQQEDAPAAGSEPQDLAPAGPLEHSAPADDDKPPAVASGQVDQQALVPREANATGAAEPAATSKRARKGHQELLALLERGAAPVAVPEGRPSRRAAAAATLAISRTVDEENGRLPVSGGLDAAGLPEPEVAAVDAATKPETASDEKKEEAAGGPCSPGRTRRVAALQAGAAIAANAAGRAFVQEEVAADIQLMPAKRGRRSQRKAAVSKEGGFMSSPLRLSVVEDGSERDGILRAVAEARSAMDVVPGRPITLRQLMKSGVLAGQEVQFRGRHGNMMLTGRVTKVGMISCHCTCCNGNPVSCSDFEEHAGSRERRPGESIYITATNTSLKEFCTAVNKFESDGTCLVCGSCEGGMLTCATCSAPCHAACTGLDTNPQEETWYCEACARVRCEQKVRQAIAATLSAAAGKAKPSDTVVGKRRRASNNSIVDNSTTVGKAAAKGPRKSKGAAAAVAEGEGGEVSGVTPDGKVHMAAPTSGVTAARRERNSNKHKRLFTGEPGGLQDGERVEYITAQGENLLGGAVVIGPEADATASSGIRCDCCSEVISCSQFEAHAGKGSRRAPYDNIYTSANISLRKLAAQMPCHELEQQVQLGARARKGRPGPGDLADIADACEELISDVDTIGSGCVLCAHGDFLRIGFGERTMIICDQCEREFHVGCLASTGRCQLEQLPEGEWFCSGDCRGIHARLRATRELGTRPLPGDHSWQIIKGKDGSHATTWSLKTAYDILQESFDPIVDTVSGRDLTAVMVYAQTLGAWDYSGMHTLLLRYKGKAVAAAVFRIFGPQLAEMPLVATRLAARRQGHCRVLLRAFESLLAEAGVQRLCLPAAHETVGTWMHGFGFERMAEEQLAVVRSELRLLIFPGTEILTKTVPGMAGATPPALPPVASEALPEGGVLQGGPSEEKGEDIAAQATAEPAEDGQQCPPTPGTSADLCAPAEPKSTDKAATSLHRSRSIALKRRRIIESSSDEELPLQTLADRDACGAPHKQESLVDNSLQDASDEDLPLQTLATRSPAAPPAKPQLPTPGVVALDADVAQQPSPPAAATDDRLPPSKGRPGRKAAAAEPNADARKKLRGQRS